jgi:hypothetical protein
MGRWTKPRLIASHGIWYVDADYDYDGPACYELGLAGPRGGRLKWMYVGETQNETHRIKCYARHGSHLSHLIDNAFEEGWHLYYWSHAFTSKALAKKRQDELLATYDYPWNRILNGDRW